MCIGMFVCGEYGVKSLRTLQGHNITFLSIFATFLLSDSLCFFLTLLLPPLSLTRTFFICVQALGSYQLSLPRGHFAACAVHNGTEFFSMCNYLVSLSLSWFSKDRNPSTSTRTSPKLIVLSHDWLSPFHLAFFAFFLSVASWCCYA